MPSRRRYALVTVAAVVASVVPSLGGAHAAVLRAHPAVQPSTAPTAPGAFVSVSPTRLLDTRRNLGATGPVAAQGTVSLGVAGVGPIPATGVAAVMLNVTVTTPARAGDVIVYADGGTRPGVSTVNFVAGQTIPNAVVAPLGSDGKVALYNQSSGSAQLLADVSGYFLAGTADAPGLYTPVTPTRLLDTRYGTGGFGVVGAYKTIALTVAGRGGVPGGGAAGAAVLNITVTAPKAAGHLTVWADGTGEPSTSNVNFVAGQTVANLVVAPVGGDGKVDIANASGGASQVIADVSGYLTSGTATTAGAYVPVTPVRLMDTRTGYPTAAPGRGSFTTMSVAGRYSLPVSQISAAVVDAVVTQPATAGDLILYPSGSQVPATSSVNFVRGGTSANLAAVPLSSGGVMSIYNDSGGPIQVIIDVFGYFLSSAPLPFAAQTLPDPPRSNNHQAMLYAVSCSDITDCVAVGSEVGNQLDYPFAEVLVGGSWVTTFPPIPANWTGQLTGVSCVPLNSTCVAVGYAVDVNYTYPLIETYSGGVWTSYLASEPINFDESILTSVSCPLLGSCVAVGAVEQGDIGNGLVETLSNGTWTPAEVRTPTSAVDIAELTGISCAGVGDCVAVGQYQSESPGAGTVGWVDTVSGAVWTPTLVGPDGTAFTGVACPASGDCLATASGGLIFSLSSGTWTAQGAGGVQTSVSCSTATTCEVGGYSVFDPAGDPRPLVDVGPAGSVLGYSPPIPAGVDTGVLSGVSCVPGGCVAVGFGSPATSASTVPIVESLPTG